MADNKSSKSPSTQAANNPRREHEEEPNTGMKVSNDNSRVGSEGNKVQGDDLEEMIPGKDRVRRGAETFDIEGEDISRSVKDAGSQNDRPTRDDGDNDDEGALK